MAALQVLILPLLSATEIVVAAPLPPILDCLQALLTARGESLFRIDRVQGVIITAFRPVGTAALGQIAALDQSGKRIHWTRGIYQLTLTLSPVEGERTRVRASARILGVGEAALPLMWPSAWWPLPSTGSLEGDLLASLAVPCPACP